MKVRSITRIPGGFHVEGGGGHGFEIPAENIGDVRRWCRATVRELTLQEKFAVAIVELMKSAPDETKFNLAEFKALEGKTIRIGSGAEKAMEIVTV